MYGSGRIRISYRSGGKQFLGRVPRAGGENRSLRIVIPSAAEGSFLHGGNQRVCAEGKRCLGAVSHATISVLP